MLVFKKELMLADAYNDLETAICEGQLKDADFMREVITNITSEIADFDWAENLDGSFIPERFIGSVISPNWCEEISS